MKALTVPSNHTFRIAYLGNDFAIHLVHQDRRPDFLDRAADRIEQEEEKYQPKADCNEDMGGKKKVKGSKLRQEDNEMEIDNNNDEDPGDMQSTHGDDDNHKSQSDNDQTDSDNESNDVHEHNDDEDLRGGMMTMRSASAKHPCPCQSASQRGQDVRTDCQSLRQYLKTIDPTEGPASM